MSGKVSPTQQQRGMVARSGGSQTVKKSLVHSWYKKRYPKRRVSMQAFAATLGEVAQKVLHDASQAAADRGSNVVETADVKPLEVLGSGKQVVVTHSTRFHIARTRFARIVRSVPLEGKRVSPCAAQVLQLITENLLQTLARNAATVKRNSNLTPDAVRVAAEVSRSPLALPTPKPAVVSSGLTSAMASRKERATLMFQ